MVSLLDSKLFSKYYYYELISLAVNFIASYLVLTDGLHVIATVHFY